MANFLQQTRDPRAGKEEGLEAETPRKTRQRGTSCARRKSVPNASPPPAATTTTAGRSSPDAHAAWQSDDVFWQLSTSTSWTTSCCEILGATSGYTRNPETYIRGPTNNETPLSGRNKHVAYFDSLYRYLFFSRRPCLGIHFFSLFTIFDEVDNDNDNDTALASPSNFG